MTKATTRKTAARKTASKTEPAVPKPMDDGPTPTSPDAGASRARMCYAAKTLLAEVAALFPEVTYLDGDRNGRGVMLGVTFEMASLSAEAADDLSTLLTLMGDAAYNRDQRIEEVVYDKSEALVLVTFRNDPRTYDSRATFGLADALLVLSGSPDDAEGVVFEDGESA